MANDRDGQPIVPGTDYVPIGPALAESGDKTLVSIGGQPTVVETARLRRVAGFASAADVNSINLQLDIINTAIDNKQPLDATLTALAALSAATGLLEQTGADSFTRRAIGVGASTSIPTRADADNRYVALANHTPASLIGNWEDGDLANAVDITEALVATEGDPSGKAFSFLGWSGLGDRYMRVLGWADLVAALPGGGVADGDKGDIVVSSGGASWAFDSAVVTTVARTLLDDTTTAAMRTTLGLGSAAERNMGIGSLDLIDLGTMVATFALLGHTHAASDIASGTMATARLGSGTASSTTFLRGDQTWNVPSLSQSSASLGADVSIGTANTWVNGPSVTLAAGTWLIVGHATILRSTTTALWVRARISTGSVHYASGQIYLASVANTSGTVALSAIVTLAGSTQIFVQATGTQTATLKAALHTNGSGNNATTINAIRIS